MRVTLDLLKQWDACERALVWFEKDYPSGVEDTLEGLRDNVIPEEWLDDWYWLLVRIAAYKNDPEGDEAYLILKRDKKGCQLTDVYMLSDFREDAQHLRALEEEENLEELFKIVRGGKESHANKAAKALRKSVDLDVLNNLADSLKGTRKALLKGEANGV